MPLASVNVNGAGLRRFVILPSKKAELAQRWPGSYDGYFMVVIALYVVAAVLVPFTLKAGNKLWKK